jgi:hypothetical protein
MAEWFQNDDGLRNHDEDDYISKTLNETNTETAYAILNTSYWYTVYQVNL